VEKIYTDKRCGRELDKRRKRIDRRMEDKKEGKMKENKAIINLE
jgi:hypothetical protein